jgi:para-aminobenzoate synthetase component 1
MRSLVQLCSTCHTPESLAAQLRPEHGLVLLRSGFFESGQARYSFLAARPFLTFRSVGSRCEVRSTSSRCCLFGNPWVILEELLGRFELHDEVDLPFPLGGCFGFWGYDLKNFIESKLRRTALNDLELPECHVGFYSSLVVFDHHLGRVWVIATGLCADGSREQRRAETEVTFWQTHLERKAPLPVEPSRTPPERHQRARISAEREIGSLFFSNLSRAEYMSRVGRGQVYIRAGDIYQVNLAQRLFAPNVGSGWKLFRRLSAVSPAPFSAYLDCGDFQIASSSPELFLRVSGSHVQSRPIKGTRPRSAEPVRDAQLAYELQTSPKESAELVMITDLLRHDLGKVCEFGSVQVPDLLRLERYPQVQHLVSTIEGRLREHASHLRALMACFPGGSITGAPKFRAMEIIDELEPVTRGPYTGALGYLGFNRESQLSITIRAAVCRGNSAWFHVGAGIVADSVPAAEYDETMAKARGFLEALEQPGPQPVRSVL